MKLKFLKKASDAQNTNWTPYVSPYETAVDTTATQHQGTEALAVNNTFTRRLLTRIALKTTARFYKRDGYCMPISKHKIVKYGPWTHLTEAATMQFVAANTSIPVPRVHCAFVHKNHGYIVMERIKGEAIAYAHDREVPEQFDKLLLQLKAMISELRALPPPANSGVQSCVGGSLTDSRISRCQPRMGPFPTIHAFHVWLRDNQDLAKIPKDHPDLQELSDMITRQDGPWPAPVSTHADLNPSNILYCGDKISGIIDWEFSGWYPHYWEYTSAWLWRLMPTEWRDQVDKFLEPCPSELKMEATRQQWWGD